MLPILNQDKNQDLLCIVQVPTLLLFVFLLFALAPPAPAQTSTGGTGAGAAGTSAPSTGTGASGPAPGVSSGSPGTDTQGQVLTLEQIVRIVVGNNSSLEIARQRLQRAQESINQVNAQTKPQFRLNANDTYSSYPAFPATLPIPTLTDPTLPDNGQIPAVTDLANSFSTAFIGTSGFSLGGTGSAGPGIASGASGVGGTAGIAVPASPSPGTAASSGGTGASGSAGSGTPTTGTGAGANGTSTAAPNTGSGASGTGGGTSGIGSGAGGTGTSPTGSSGNGTGTSAPAAGTGSAAPGASASPASGAALPAIPAIVAAYVADPHTLQEPPEARAPALTVRIAPITPEADAARPQAETTSRQDDATTGSAASVTTAPARGRRDTYATGANVTQYIDVFGLGGTARKAETDVRDFYALDIARLQNETALAAKNLFFNVLYTQTLVATQQEQVTYAQEDVRITQSRLRNGIVSRFDVLTAQAALATAQQQLTAAQDQSELAQSELSYVLGTDPDQPQALQEPPLPPLDQTISIKQTTQIALQQRPELRQAGLNVDNAQRQIRLAQAGLLPILGLVGTGEYTSNGSTVTPSRYAAISLQAAVPLDDAGLTRSRVRSAQVQVQTQAVTQQQLQLSVTLEVRQASVNIRSAQAEVGAAQVGVARSQEALRLARERYGAGLGTFLDVLNALAQLATARTNLANGQYFYQSSLAQLVRAMGGR